MDRDGNKYSFWGNGGCSNYCSSEYYTRGKGKLTFISKATV